MSTGNLACSLKRDPATRGILAAALLRGELWLIGLGLVGAVWMVGHYF